jgi:two-component system chemotaxis response regulator CheY
MPADSRTPILIVDDEWMMIEIMTALLKRLGFDDVDFASDGASALALMRQKSYRLVISDLNMDGMSGLKFLRAVRQDPDLKATPFILTTASQSIEDAVAAKHAGVDNYLLKPFSAEKLQQKLTAILSRPSAVVGTVMARPEKVESVHRSSWRSA